MLNRMPEHRVNLHTGNQHWFYAIEEVESEIKQKGVL